MLETPSDVINNICNSSYLCNMLKKNFLRHRHQ